MKQEEIKKNFEYLLENGYLEYGCTIPVNIFEQLFMMDYQNTMEFIGPFLTMKEHLEEQGFLTTTKGCQEPGSLRIYDSDEIATRSSVIFNLHIRKMSMLEKCLHKTDTTNFGFTDKGKLMLELNKITASLNSMKSTLKNI